MAITQEDCISAHRAEKRQKVSPGPSKLQPSRYRLIQNPVPRAPPRSVPAGRWVARPPQQPDSTGHQCLNLCSSNDHSVQDQTPCRLIREITSIDVSTVVVRRMLLKTAHNQVKHSPDRPPTPIPTPTPGTKARGRLCRSIKEE
jgi:hypothetical protein